MKKSKAVGFFLELCCCFFMGYHYLALTSPSTTESIMNKRICVVAAGSGGHILPTIALARQKTSLPLVAITRNAPLEHRIFKEQPNIAKTLFVSLVNLRQKGLLGIPLFIVQATIVFFKTLFFLKKENITTVITTGGYLAVPVFFAAWFLGIERICCELNHDLGVTIKLLKPLSTQICYTFPETEKMLPAHKSQFIDYPLRFTKKHQEVTRAEAIAWINNQLTQNELSFSENRKTIFVMGGSQGSRALNNLFMHLSLQDLDIQIIHQTGNADLKELKVFYESQNIPYLVFGYHNNIEFCYQAADIVVTRAGAGSLFELLFFNKKALIIPLEGAAGNHQLTNAKSFKTRNPEQFVLIRQNTLLLNPQDLKEAIKNLN